MKIFTNFYIFLVILTYTINFASAHITHLSSHKNIKRDDSEKGDNFYIIILENIYKNATLTENSKIKRDSNDQYIDGVIDEINTLIIGNKDSYINPGKLDELEDQDIQLRKRNNQEDESWLDNVNSSYVYKISSTENKTVLYAYLSNSIAEMVASMSNIISCKPDKALKITPNYNSKEMMRETGWSGISRRYNSKLHLSLVSQGKFNEKLVNEYDDTYYYPSSAGKDINIVILDFGFNFRNTEFKGSDRILQCAFNITNAKAIIVDTKDYCYGNNYDIPDHGSILSDIAAGKMYGAAPKANVYGVLLNYDYYDYYESLFFGDIIKALDTIKTELLKPYRTILNMSFGLFVDDNVESLSEQLSYMQELINEISEKAVIVTSSGNSNQPAIDKENEKKHYPSSFNNVISVGSIDNQVVGLKVMNSTLYRKSSFSNYGEGVDIYAPGYFYASYQDSKFVNRMKSVDGTSYSAALVSGVIATIMGENLEVNYNTSSMLKHLNTIGLKNKIKDLPKGSNNLFINNGKHVVYSNDNVYHGCGVESGNQKCPDNYCC